MQESFIGRHKFSDIELDDDKKDPAAHTVVAQDNRDDEEHKIVRMNVAFAQPGQGVRGTYFIGYARYWDVTKTMLTNMFTQMISCSTILNRLQACYSSFHPLIH